MGFVLLAALAFAVVVFVAGTILIARTTIRLFRDVGSLLRGFADATEALARRLARLGESTEDAAGKPADLEEALERLAVSRARLRVLTSALERVRAEAGVVTAFLPRK